MASSIWKRPRTTHWMTSMPSIADFEALMKGSDYQDLKLVANAWCAAFTDLKTKDAGFRLTEEEFSVIMANPRTCPGRCEQGSKQKRKRIIFPLASRVSVCIRGHREARDSAHRWSGGFDVMLGNPPCDKLEFKEKEWF